MTDMDRGLEAQLRDAVDEAGVRIIADDPKVRRLTAWVMEENIQLELGEETDYNELLSYIDRKYGYYDQSVIDTAMLICEREIEEAKASDQS